MKESIPLSARVMVVAVLAATTAYADAIFVQPHTINAHVVGSGGSEYIRSTDDISGLKLYGDSKSPLTDCPVGEAGCFNRTYLEFIGEGLDFFTKSYVEVSFTFNIMAQHEPSLYTVDATWDALFSILYLPPTGEDGVYASFSDSGRYTGIREVQFTDYLQDIPIGSQLLGWNLSLSFQGVIAFPSEAACPPVCFFDDTMLIEVPHNSVDINPLNGTPPQAASVPEPGTLLTIASALLAGVGFVRKKIRLGARDE